MSRVAAGAIGAFLAVFMVATVLMAVLWDDRSWGWWWAVPVGTVFVVFMIGFRLVVARMIAASETEDTED